MRFTIVTLFLALIAALPEAGRAEGDFCQTQYKIGRKVMENRQGGTSLAKMLQINADANLSPLERTLYDQIVIQAYDQPLYRTERNKDEAIGEYANKIMLDCLKGAEIAAEASN